MKTWDDSLKTGHDKIDSHHEELFQLDSLIDNAVDSASVEDLNSVILFLEEYVIDHFKEEEHLMQDHNYAYYSEHKDEHDHFTQVVKTLRNKFNSDFPRAHVIFQTRRLVDDLVHHIKHTDIGIAHLEHSWVKH